ncbi:chemotaxis protein CheB [Massilia sp. WF1]|uniref:chemotaxis-specific protein-glutamate methyltransferase CheB n=1 Tax=unclassified Massilia TaxID=2609279 RepID=UPI00064B5777|nr:MULTISPECIES: chemotaxis-specific protein-glutamate methyltransferase CheB [unclassified Massilia]ALK96418.1 chemotaxis response regulator protein-glutamate methylesterase [Massilia sp. WG5]KLU37828.1 chemotaxis protein CheB [Massilia sp. WF1]
MRIGIASNMPVAADALREVLLASGEHRLAWVARTGVDAVRLCADLRPDLVLMDLDMPLLDGVEATRRIMANAPCAILIVTARPQENVGQVFRALGAGALDVVGTPVLPGQPGFDAALLAKIRTIGKLVAGRPAPVPVGAPHVARLVAIGASTGGPVALARLFAGWQPPPDTAAVVIQHIDSSFAARLVKWLGEQTSAKVAAIADGDHLAGGVVQVATTADHLRLAPGHRLRYDAHPRDELHRPSIDVFFRSVARYWERGGVGVLLTGMGRDGAAGLLAMREAGQSTIAQDEASSAVYGMPRAAAELGAAQHILPLDNISKALSGKIGGLA